VRSHLGRDLERRPRVQRVEDRQLEAELFLVVDAQEHQAAGDRLEAGRL
jgi:hypothetical protein